MLIMAGTVNSEHVTELNRVSCNAENLIFWFGFVEKQWVREPVPPGLTVVKTLNMSHRLHFLSRSI